MKKIHDAYWAGIIDGEGTLTIKRQKYSHTTFPLYHTIFIKVAMTNADIPQLLHEEFGGGFRVLPAKENRRMVFEWCVTSKKALAFLLRIHPYLILKAEHAKLCLELQNTMRRSGTGRPYKLSKEMYDRRDNIFRKVHSLNIKKGKARAEKVANSVDPATGNAVGNPEPSPKAVNA